MLLTEVSLPRARSLDDRGFNVGTGIETSVNDLAGSLTRASDGKSELIHADARAGELRHSSLNADRLRGLGWEPRTDLEDGLRQTYEWIASKR
jgi:UDP-glucose 4-epimerase